MSWMASFVSAIRTGRSSRARLLFGMPISISQIRFRCRFDAAYKRSLAAGIVTALLGGCSSGSSSTRVEPQRAQHIVIDGSLDDWTSPMVAVPSSEMRSPSADSAGAAISAIGEFADPRYLYLRLALPRVVSLYGLTSTLSIDIDADNNTTTGADGDGLAGTDFAIDLSPTINGRVSEGAAVRVMHAGSVAKTVDTYGLDFVLLPTYATQNAELRIARGRRIDPAAAPVFSGNAYRVQVAVHDASGAVRYRTPVVTGTLPPLDTSVAVPTTDPLARAPNTAFRALVWNVANEGLRDRPEHFRRIIAAIDPDLLVLDEVGGVVGREGTGRFLASIDEGRSRPQWQYTYGGGGGYQRTVIAARTSVTEFPEFSFIPFPDSVTKRIVAAIPEANRARQHANIDSGVATGGALVLLNGKRVAVFGVDLQSAGNRLGSWQEMRRQDETRIIRDRAIAAINRHGPVDAVIAAGDHNLVGTRTPLEIMGEIGTGVLDHRRLAVATNLVQLDGATAATWEGSGGQFPPGRLDWFSYSPSSLEVAGGFIFDVADLAPRWQAFHHLESDDSKKSSDHRPVVVDVRWRNGTR